MDTRYYYFTILAIFMALGLGMLLGGSWINNEQILSEQKRFVGLLESEFAELRLENKSFKREIQELEVGITENQRFIADILPLFFQDLFSGERIGLMVPPELESKINILNKALSSSGAETIFLFNDEINNLQDYSSVIVLNQALGKEDLGSQNILFWEGNIEDPLQIFRLLWKLKTK